MSCTAHGCTNTGTLRCSGCKSAYYCSPGCQKKSWKSHKKVCKEIQSTLDGEIERNFNARSLDIPTGMENIVNMFTEAGLTDYTLPEFHEEYRKKYPRNNPGYKVLKDGYTNMQMGAFMRRNSGQSEMSHVLSSYGSCVQVLTKRWNLFGPDLIEYLSSEPLVGDVYRDHPHISCPPDYLESSGWKKYQIMRNTAVHPTEMIAGQSYVSVGFVDLQAILAADVIGDEGAVCWYGYDMSEICVARAKIILELMMSEECNSKDILQIWFSTCMSRKAQRALQKCCQNLHLKENNLKVKKLLKHWSSSLVDAADARIQWSQYLGTYQLGVIPQLKAQSDRVDYAHYLLTGELFMDCEDQNPVGNATMFSLPKDYVHYKKSDENFLTTLSIKMLQYKTSLKRSIEDLHFHRMENARKLVQDRSIVIEVDVKKFDLDNVDIFPEIRMMEPARIDWSNVPDYLTKENFFKMAQKCSGSSTQHTFHLMNWGCKVFGTNIFDYVPFKEYPRLEDVFSDPSGKVQSVYNELKKEWKSVLDDVQSHLCFANLGVESLNAMNTSETILCHRYLSSYMNYMFENQKVNGTKWKMDDYSPFDRSNSLAQVEFKFIN
eukprot:GFUD01008057.1.p1 GENE.GFUD01008057.1~~GFUD01008057.1.p1  ORF type:complete len:603 (+),score=99.82 GFUD01008057.1:51-1859(+)